MNQILSTEKTLPTILIVDDTPANIGVVAENLEAHGYRVLVAQDGEEGLQRADFMHPDLIMLDVMMPGIDGFEVCRRLKKEAKTRDIPVIFMTARTEVDDKLQGFKAGAVDYVTKPLQIDEVIARVETQLSLSALQKRLATQNSQLQRYREQLEQRVAERTAELSDNNQRLRREIQERKQAEQQALMMGFALDHVREAAYLCDENFRFIYVNEEACRALGYSREELLTMSVFDIDPDLTTVGAEQLKSSVDVTLAHTIVRRHKTKDGHIFPVEIFVSIFEYQGKKASISLARDITERKKFEAQEQIRLRIFERIAKGAEQDEVLGLVVNYVEQSFPDCLSSIMLLDEEGKHLLSAVAPSLPQDYTDAVNGVAIGDGVGSCGTAAWRGETVITEDIDTHPYWTPFKHLALGAGLRACWSEPIFSAAGQVLGSFGIYRRVPGKPGEDEVELVRRACHLAAIAIERKQTEHDLDQSRNQLRGLSARREEAREEERKHIAREVHDELGQILTGLKLNVSVLNHKFSPDSPALREQLQETMQLTDRALAVARNIASALRPAALDMGIVSALEWLTGRFAANTGVNCEMHIDDADIQLEENHAIALFRIVQESLTNISRYAKADKVDVGLYRDGGDYVLKVRDNGVGFDASIKKVDSYGLLGMRERALMLSGELVINSSPGNGTEIVVRIPANSNLGAA
jgi:PAS domain S-box-containing protein